MRRSFGKKDNSTSYIQTNNIFRSSFTFCTVTCLPINTQQCYLDASTAAGNQLWIRSLGLPRRRGRVFTKLSTDTPLVFKRNDRTTNLHWQVINLELGEVAPPAKNLLRFQSPAAASSKPAQKVIYNQGFGLRARFRWFFISIMIHTLLRFSRRNTTMILQTASDLECYNVSFVRIHQMWPKREKWYRILVIILGNT